MTQPLTFLGGYAGRRDENRASRARLVNSITSLAYAQHDLLRIRSGADMLKLSMIIAATVLLLECVGAIGELAYLLT